MTVKQIEQWAKDFGADPRTVRRWVKLGAPLDNREAMLSWLSNRKQLPGGTQRMVKEWLQKQNAATTPALSYEQARARLLNVKAEAAEREAALSRGELINLPHAWESFDDSISDLNWLDGQRDYFDQLMSTVAAGPDLPAGHRESELKALLGEFVKSVRSYIRTTLPARIRAKLERPDPNALAPNILAASLNCLREIGKTLSPAAQAELGAALAQHLEGAARAEQDSKA